MFYCNYSEITMFSIEKLKFKRIANIFSMHSILILNFVFKSLRKTFSITRKTLSLLFYESICLNINLFSFELIFIQLTFNDKCEQGDYFIFFLFFGINSK